MTIPSLPTDNLYKFIALFGVLILLITVLYPMSLNIKSSEKMYQIKSSRKQIDFELNEMHSKDDMITNRIKEINENSKLDSIENKSYTNFYSIAYTDSILLLCRNKDFREYFSFIENNKAELFPIHAKYNEIEKLNEEREKIRLLIKDLLILQNKKNSEIEYELYLFDTFKYMIMVMGILGTVLTFLGFFLWYIRVQKYLDIKLKNEALSIKYENGDDS